MLQNIAPLSISGLVAGLTALVFALPTPVDSVPEEARSGTLIENVRIVSEGNALSAPVSILIEDGLISHIGETPEAAPATKIDGTGLTALPGLIDSHTHTYGSAQEDAVRFGVTTMLDMFTDPSLFEESHAARASLASTPKADLFSAGMLATAPGGHGTQFGVPVDTLTAPDQAPAWVAARKAEGSDYIKLVYMPGIPSLPSIDRETAKAVIEAGHAEGLMVVAHISAHDGAAAMVEDGIDGLVHVFADRPVSDELLAAVKAKGIFIIPTLSVLAAISGDNEAPELTEDEQAFLSPMQVQTLGMSFGREIPGYSLAVAMENTGRFHAAGVPILAGSDAPNPGTAHGVSLHDELGLLVRSGLTETEALTAATSTPARLFGLDGRGVIQAGARADLVLVEGDPTREIGTTRNIRHILKNGHAIARTLAEQPAGASVTSDLFGDFEDGLGSLNGFEWVAATDEVAGGASVVTLARAEGGAQGSGHALKIEASVKRGFPFPWSGASVMLSQSATSGPPDISGYSGLSFDIKGTPGSYRVMAFSAGAQGIPPTQNVTLTENWETQVLQLSDFTGFQASNLVGFAFVAGPTLGESTIYLDNVKLVK